MWENEWSMGSRSVGRPRKRWIDTVNDCQEKRERERGLDWMLGKQGRLCMIGINDTSERWNAWGLARGMNP